MKYLGTLWLWLCTYALAAEVIAVPPIASCFLCSSEPSLTMYWPGKDAQTVLILIPGGEGYIGLKPTQTDHPFHQFQTLKRLTDPTLTRGRVDFVLLDSPAALSPNQPYPFARGSTDHLIRIESVIRFYQQKTGRPVWLMGHSNGGISLTEFVKYAQQNHKMDLIAGMVASGIRSESYFDAPLGFPVLFIHHQNDACAHTLPERALRNYEKIKAFNTAPTEFIYVSGGQAEARDPCRSGFHMYYDAGEEVAKAIDAFIARSSR